MFKIAVHLHIYYSNMWEVIKFYLNNLDSPYHLYVTMIENDIALQSKIKEFHSNTTFFIIENKGYDVGPFIYFINKINLNDYDLILKIHTKNNRNSTYTRLNRRWIDRENWFKLLMSSLLGSKKIFHANLDEFKKDKSLGMIGSRYLITSEESVSRKLKKHIEDAMLFLKYEKPSKIKFIAGTMFIIRSQLLAKIAQKYKLEDFETTNGSVKDGTLAHVLERVFGCVVCSEGFCIKGFDRDYKFEYQERIRSCMKFIYSRKDTKNNYRLVKLFKIPVYYRKILALHGLV